VFNQGETAAGLPDEDRGLTGELLAIGYELSAHWLSPFSFELLGFALSAMSYIYPVKQPSGSLTKTGVSPGSYQLIHNAFLLLTNKQDRDSVAIK